MPSPECEGVYSILSNVCALNQINYDEHSLRSLARQSCGDVRASMIDLFVSSFSGGLNKDSILPERLRNRNVEDSLRLIFNTTKAGISLSAFENTDMDLHDSMMWLEENIPKEYCGIELNKAYDALSKADVYLGRIRKWQHWRFLVYANALLTAGVSLSKTEEHRKVTDVNYSRNTRPLKYWIMNNKNAKRKPLRKSLLSNAMFQSEKL